MEKYKDSEGIMWSKSTIENIFNSIIDLLKPILEPVTVDYSKEMLANQIYRISIILFIISLLIIILLIAFNVKRFNFNI